MQTPTTISDTCTSSPDKVCHRTNDRCQDKARLLQEISSLDQSRCRRGGEAHRRTRVSKKHHTRTTRRSETLVWRRGKWQAPKKRLGKSSKGHDARWGPRPRLPTAALLDPSHHAPSPPDKGNNNKTHPGAGAPRAWRRRSRPSREQSRFRRGGAAALAMHQALDHPVRDGYALAATGDVLPSDWWRGQMNTMEGLEEKRLEGAVQSGLRYEDGERDGGFTLDSIVREEPGYTVRNLIAVQQKGRVGVKELEESKNVGIGHTDGEPVAMESDETDHIADGPLTDESGSDDESDSESLVDDECEHDFLHDFEQVEAQGWVPVMIPEEGGDDWMSLTGSLVLMPARERRGKGLIGIWWSQSIEQAVG
ncbi:hypothetical protein N656DRAFT_183615 [Canariomyces notabilis]|uniref:Uncharacterized protein n=1 Tax=Canariomyces notabilis TaxID=2074819 RepID=A0AAN6QIZ6_9PEZI|nr:hypothetical protein N656DRAFT_183615 [Canariomyces arenarius]